MGVTELTGQEALSSKRTVDYIIPYPYGSNIRLGEAGFPSPYLSLMSQMAIDAGAYVFSHHPEARIVLAGESPYGPGFPSTTDLMIQRARDTFQVPVAALLPVVRDDGLGNDNTYLQAEALVSFFEELPAGEVLVIPLAYHLRRVAHTMRAYGAQAPLYATAQSVLAACGVKDYDCYAPIIEGLEKSERILRLVNEADPRGRLLNKIMARKGARLVDVTTGEDGKTRLENGYAQEKLKQLCSEMRGW